MVDDKKNTTIAVAIIVPIIAIIIMLLSFNLDGGIIVKLINGLIWLFDSPYKFILTSVCLLLILIPTLTKTGDIDLPLNKTLYIGIPIGIFLLFSLLSKYIHQYIIKEEMATYFDKLPYIIALIAICILTVVIPFLIKYGEINLPLFKTLGVTLPISLFLIISLLLVVTKTKPPSLSDVAQKILGAVDNGKVVDIGKVIQHCYQYIGMFIFIVFLLFVVYFAESDPGALTKNAYKYAFSIFIPLFLLVGYYLQQNTATGIIGLLVMCIIALIGSYIYITTSKVSMTVANIFTKYLLIPLIFMVGLAIVYKAVMEYTAKLTGWNKFIAELIFYIPCMLIDLFEYFKQQYKITPNVVFILFVFEILLVLLYISIPKLIKTKFKSGGTTLLDNPVFLNKEKVIGTSKVAIISNKEFVRFSDDSTKYRTNYAISLWANINTQSTSNAAYAKETTIFEYGSTDPTGNVFIKPRIAYKMDDSGDKFYIYFSKLDDSSKMEIYLPTQKWNHFVFNYYNSKVDLFINGKLERTFDMTGKMPQYSVNDVFKVGSENGLDGAICSVDYFSAPLKNTDIANIYNLFMMKNTPI
jgi:hypothetical protein